MSDRDACEAGVAVKLQYFRAVCQRLGISMIIRGHQAPLHGYSLFADGRLVTLFSAPGYKVSQRRDACDVSRVACLQGTTADTVNMGASLFINELLEITVNQVGILFSNLPQFSFADRRDGRVSLSSCTRSHQTPTGGVCPFLPYHRSLQAAHRAYTEGDPDWQAKLHM